jgi:hypothetical protein
VRLSRLKRRDILAWALQQFGEDAKVTSRSLYKLSSKLNGAVDRYVGSFLLAAQVNLLRYPLVLELWPYMIRRYRALWPCPLTLNLTLSHPDILYGRS